MHAHMQACARAARARTHTGTMPTGAGAKASAAVASAASASKRALPKRGAIGMRVAFVSTERARQGVPERRRRGALHATCRDPPSAMEHRLVQVSKAVEEVLQETLNLLAAAEEEDVQPSRQVRGARGAQQPGGRAVARPPLMPLAHARVLSHRRSRSPERTSTRCSTPTAMPTALPRASRWIWCGPAATPVCARAPVCVCVCVCVCVLPRQRPLVLLRAASAVGQLRGSANLACARSAATSASDFETIAGAGLGADQDCRLSFRCNRGACSAATAHWRAHASARPRTHAATCAARVCMSPRRWRSGFVYSWCACACVCA